MPSQSDSPSLYVGLMSGTSMDGVDAALVEFGNRTCRVIEAKSIAYPEKLRAALFSASRTPGKCTVDRIGELDHWVGECFRDATLELLAEAGADAKVVAAIGSHGQTLRHQPQAERPFTLQIGDPNIIAAGTGIATIADFRRRDIAVGGQGAPLAPAFHRWLFSSKDGALCILNIGGFANVTILPTEDGHVSGFDTGPGNSLMDSWANAKLGVNFDDNGDWAKSGRVSETLLSAMLEDSYFGKPPPKSTGFEYFDVNWIEQCVLSSGITGIEDADLQATLAELTARTIADAIRSSADDVTEILVCGGGVHNSHLMQRLRCQLPDITVNSTESRGLHPDWIEATAFAWLAKRYLDGKPGNIPAVTGASRPATLGALYSGCG
ncbi:MAG: anhydro-N-acetylmuramic acid kinase [Woeseiaceae bacterium]